MYTNTNCFLSQPEYKMADPICTFLFSLFVLGTTFTIMRDILVVLMEGKPQPMNINDPSLCPSPFCLAPYRGVNDTVISLIWGQKISDQVCYVMQ